jgi:hypothetical protein
VERLATVGVDDEVYLEIWEGSHHEQEILDDF